MNYSDVTIAVVPRERFSHTAQTLENIYTHTPRPLQLVYVDGGSPPRIARYLRDQAREKGFKLIRTDHYLSPNEARNIALTHTQTKYIVFLDNDIIVSPGWLEALIECAEETGAWIVGPWTMYESLDGKVVHAGPREMRIDEVDGRRLFVEENIFANRKLAELPSLTRQPCEQLEFHCLLARRECLEAVGEFDEKLLCTREHCDLSFLVREAGGLIYFEPRAVVELPSLALKLSDLPYFLLRWSEAWSEASVKHFRQKRRIADDDPLLGMVRSWTTTHRQSFWRARPFLYRLTRGRSDLIERLVLGPIEVRLNRLVARRAARGRPRSGNAHVAGNKFKPETALSPE